MQPRLVEIDHAGHWRGQREWTPGILVEWRRTGSGWEGLVLYARGGGELPWTVQLRWVRETDLRPVHVRPLG